MQGFRRCVIVTACGIAALVPFSIVAAASAGAAVDCGAPPAPHVDYTGCDLSGADLTGADLTGATLVSTNLTGATLTNATLTDAELFSANFTSAALAGVVSGGIPDGPATLPPGWTLRYGYLLGPGANLARAQLAHDNLTGLALAGANLTGAELGGSQLSSSDLRNANFYGADLYDTVLNFVGAGGADFSGAYLTGVSGLIAGAPAGLPPGWTLTHEVLLGKGVDLTGTPLLPPNITVGATGRTTPVTWSLPIAGTFCNPRSGTRFHVGATTVDCAIATGNGGAVGTFVVTVVAPPTITQQPLSTTVAAGSQATFTASATSEQAPEVQWQVSTDAGVTFTNLSDGAGVSGSATPTLHIVTDPSMNHDRFRVVFTNNGGSTTSRAVRLTVT